MTSFCGNLQMDARVASKRTPMISQSSGELEQMGVQFREVDPFNLWVSPKTVQML